MALKVAAEPEVVAEPGARALKWGSTLIGIMGVLVILNGLAFVVSTLLGQWEVGEGLPQVGKTPDQVIAFSPSLYHYLAHAELGMSGGIIALGLALIYFALGIARGHGYALTGAVTILVAFLAIGLPAHYPWHLATLVHLGPAYLMLVIFAVGAVLSYRGLSSQKG